MDRSGKRLEAFGDPTWSPDGRTIIFRSDRYTGRGDLYRKQSDGSQNEELLYTDGLTRSPAAFSPDGKYLVYVAQDPANGFDLEMLADPWDRRVHRKRSRFPL